MSRIDNPDTPADIGLRNVLDSRTLNEFAMIAGAGSGKTTSLVKALSHIIETRGNELAARSQKAACITYTEVAAAEIYGEVGGSPLVWVSTIHSFLWHVIEPLQVDIRTEIVARVSSKVETAEAALATLSTSTAEGKRKKAADDVERYRSRLDAVRAVDRFRYGMGSDYASGIIGHEDVIKIACQLVERSELLAMIVGRSFPFILVDESQDTFPEVVSALKKVSKVSEGRVALGYFGDPMQQIYQRGTGRIELPEGAPRIEKPENFRSSNQVLAVVNAVRARTDSLVQIQGRKDEEAYKGTTHLFICDTSDDRTATLSRIQSWLSGDNTGKVWSDETTKILTIVHRMAARRLGFGELFDAFHVRGASLSLGQSFDEGNAWPLRPVRDVIYPICLESSDDSGEIIKVLREYSPILKETQSAAETVEQLAHLHKVVQDVRAIAKKGGEGSMRQILHCAIVGGLVEADDRLTSMLGLQKEDSPIDIKVKAILEPLLECNFHQYTSYRRYVESTSPFSTQHGTKGSEFDRVLVVLDDEESTFTLYSYNKLLGLAELSANDKKNIAAGVDSVIERTNRLLYVCVSRARQDLAVALFVEDVDTALHALNGELLGSAIETIDARSLQ